MQQFSPRELGASDGHPRATLTPKTIQRYPIQNNLFITTHKVSIYVIGMEIAGQAGSQKSLQFPDKVVLHREVKRRCREGLSDWLTLKTCYFLEFKITLGLPKTVDASAFQPAAAAARFSRTRGTSG